MAEFSTTIKSKYSVDTFENTKKTYEWIYAAIKEAKLMKAKIKEDFLFNVGKITCSCDSIKEFTENTYGQLDYRLIYMKIFQIDIRSNSNLFVTVDNNGISISSNSKSNIEKIIQLLEKKPQKNGVTIVENQYNIGDINGSYNNVNQGADNVIALPTDKEKNSKFKHWVEAILQNLLANWIWIAIPAAIAFIAGSLL